MATGVSLRQISLTQLNWQTLKTPYLVQEYDDISYTNWIMADFVSKWRQLVAMATRWSDRESKSNHSGSATSCYVQRYQEVAVEATISLSRLPDDSPLNHRSDAKSSHARKGSAATSNTHRGASWREPTTIRICLRFPRESTSSTSTSSPSHGYFSQSRKDLRWRQSQAVFILRGSKGLALLAKTPGTTKAP